MLIGDCTLDVAHALNSGESPAQLSGPFRPVYPKVETLTLGEERGNRLVPWMQDAEASFGARYITAMTIRPRVCIFLSFSFVLFGFEEGRSPAWVFRR